MQNLSCTHYDNFIRFESVKIRAITVNIPSLSGCCPSGPVVEGAVGPSELGGPPFPQTPASARQWFKDNGIAVKAWSQRHGYSLHTVEALLRGRIGGSRGAAFLAAVDLGLKPRPFTINRQSHAEMLATLDRVRACILELDALGVEVLELRQAFPPIIHVQASPAVTQLDGQPGREVELDGFRTRTFATTRCGCLVRWLDASRG